MPSASETRVREIFQEDGVTVYRLDLRAIYGSPDEACISEWVVMSIGKVYVRLLPIDTAQFSEAKVNFAMLLKAYDLAQEDGNCDSASCHELHIFTDQAGSFDVSAVQGNRLPALAMRVCSVNLSPLMKELKQSGANVQMAQVKATFNDALAVVSEKTLEAEQWVARTRPFDFLGTIEPLPRKSKDCQGLLRACNTPSTILKMLKISREVCLIVRLHKKDAAPQVPHASPVSSLEESIELELPEQARSRGGFGGRGDQREDERDSTRRSAGSSSRSQGSETGPRTRKHKQKRPSADHDSSSDEQEHRRRSSHSSRSSRSSSKRPSDGSREIEMELQTKVLEEIHKLPAKTVSAQKEMLLKVMNARLHSSSAIGLNASKEKYQHHIESRMRGLDKERAWTAGWAKASDTTDHVLREPLDGQGKPASLLPPESAQWLF
jgi:hypothetical protein